MLLGNNKMELELLVEIQLVSYTHPNGEFLNYARGEHGNNEKGKQ
jgi:hypothetical protein